MKVEIKGFNKESNPSLISWKINETFGHATVKDQKVQFINISPENKVEEFSKESIGRLKEIGDLLQEEINKIIINEPKQKQ